VSPWTWAKYALTLAGIALIVTGDRIGRHWLGYVGLGLVIVAFLLRLAYRVPRHPQ
jgi:hypothetical protein